MANTLRFKRGLVAGIPTGVAGEPLFTTDTFDLYIGNGTTNTRFQKYIASGTTLQYLRGDGSLATFPTNIVTGTGTTNYLPKFTGASTLGNSNLISDANGNLGFQQTPNASALANTLILVRDGTLISSGGTYIHFLTNSYYSTDWKYNASSLATRYSQEVGSHNWYTAPSGTANATITWTERARITSGGNFIINNPSTDNGLRFQVTGDGYFSGSVGMGVAAPVAKLHLQIPSATNTNTEIFRATDSVYCDFKILLDRKLFLSTSIARLNTASGIMAFETSNTERMFLDASGNLGLAVVPSAWISVYKAFNIGTKGFVYSRTDTDETAIGTNWYRNSAAAFIYSTNGNASLYAQTTGQHQWFNAPSGTAGGTVTFTQPMTLTANGRLLLGTTIEQTYRLAVAGDVKFDADAATNGFYWDNTNKRLGIGTNAPVSSLHILGNQFRIEDNDPTITLKRNVTSAFGGHIDWVTNNNTLGFQIANNALVSAAVLEFNHSGVNRMVLTSGGNVGIGTTGPTAKLDVSGTFNATGAATFSSSLTAASLVVDTTTLVVDATNDRVGIGTASPVSKLDVIQSGTTAGISVSGGTNPNMKATDGTITAKVQAITGVAAYIGTESNHQLSLIVNNIPRLTIDTTGAATFTDNARFSNLKGCIFVQTGGTLLGSIGMDSSNAVTIDNNGFFGLSVASNYTMTAGNLGIGHGNFGTSATKTISVSSGTAPSTSPADGFQMYSNDVVAGNAAPHFRTENGAVIKIYQETTAVGNSTISVGGGSAVLDDTQFGGYTLRQVVKALQNQGILA